MAKMGRPTIEIDWEQFEKLCGLHCTLIEIAAWFKCSMDTIERACKRHYKESFAEVYSKKKSVGSISIRRKMYEIAMGGNCTMLIWLSKNLLGFTDKIEQQVGAEVHANVVYESTWGSSVEHKENT